MDGRGLAIRLEDGRSAMLPHGRLPALRCLAGRYIEVESAETGVLRLYLENGRMAAEWKLAQEYLHKRCAGRQGEL